MDRPRSVVVRFCHSCNPCWVPGVACEGTCYSGYPTYEGSPRVALSHRHGYLTYEGSPRVAPSNREGSEFVCEVASRVLDVSGVPPPGAIGRCIRRYPMSDIRRPIPHGRSGSPRFCRVAAKTSPKIGECLMHPPLSDIRYTTSDTRHQSLVIGTPQCPWTARMLVVVVSKYELWWRLHHRLPTSLHPRYPLYPISCTRSRLMKRRET